MGASRVVTIRRSARAGVIGLVAAVGTVMLPSAALADTTIGSIAAIPAPCPAGYDLVQVSSTGASYTVTAPGNITSWNIQQGAVGVGPVGLEVWHPATTPGSYTLVDASPLVTLGVTVPPFNLATPIPVQAGDVIGLRVEGNAGCGQSTTNAGDVYGWAHQAAATKGATVAMTQTTNFLLNVSANVAAVTPPPPPPPPPTPGTKEDCKDGGWQQLVDASGQQFQNQGDCVSSVASQHDENATGDTSGGSSGDPTSEQTDASNE
jgi:hypothetical protein